MTQQSEPEDIILTTAKLLADAGAEGLTYHRGAGALAKVWRPFGPCAAEAVSVVNLLMKDMPEAQRVTFIAKVDAQIASQRSVH